MVVYLNDTIYVIAYNTTRVTAQALKQSGDDLTHENPMHQATNLKNFQSDMTLSDVVVTTSPIDYGAFHSARLGRFDGKSWMLFGDLISG